MGVMTDDMTRLRDEIGASRGARRALITDTEDFVTDTADTVSQMRAGFREAQAERAADDRAGRLGFVADLNRKVAGMRAEFAADLEGAGRAWFGPRRATTTTTETAPRAAGRKSKSKARARAR